MKGGRDMNTINISNKNIQFNPYVASREVQSLGKQAEESVKVGAQSNASVNEYGDEFVRSSIYETEDGAVYSKPVVGDDDAARVPGGEELPKIDSLIGYTASQVEQFYQQGRISRYDYDTKMEQRKEFLSSVGMNNESEDAQKVKKEENKNTTGEKAAEAVAKEEEAKVALEKDDAKLASEKNDANKAESNKVAADDRRTEADREKVYETGKEAKKEIATENGKEVKELNKKMSAISDEQRSNEEFEIIESGNDPAATFKLVQDLNNLASGVLEGSTWNIA